MVEREQKLDPKAELPTDLNRVRDMIDERRNEYKVHELAQRDSLTNMKEIEGEILSLIDHAKSGLGITPRRDKDRERVADKPVKKDNEKTP